MTTYADAKAALQAVLVTAQPQGAITPERLATALVALTDALNDLATADKYVVGLQSYNSTTNVLTLLLSDASTVDINMTTLIADAVADRIPTSEKAAANGVASLDGSGKLATAQRPTTDGITEGTTNLYHTASRVNALISAAAGSVVQAFSATLSSLAALTTTTFGRSLLTETSASTLKTTLALTKSDVGLSSVDNTADASKSFTASQISNSTTVGRNVLTAVDQAAARSAIGVREVLTADRTYYVRTDGSNSNTGLANTSGGAFLTIQKALDVIGALDTGVYNVTLQIGDGTYTAGNTVYPILGGGTFTIQGNSGTPANVLISTTNADGFSLSNRTSVTIKDLKIVVTTSGMAIRLGAFCTLNYTNINFGACAERHIHYAGQSSRAIATGNYTISGGAVMHVSMTNGPSSAFECYGRTITLSGTPAFSNTYIAVGALSYCQHAVCTFSGSATGKRYDVADGGIIEVSGGGTSYFPGNSAGTGTNFSASPWGLYK